VGSARFKSLPTNSFVFYKEKAFGYCCFTHQSKAGGTHELELPFNFLKIIIFLNLMGIITLVYNTES